MDGRHMEPIMLCTILLRVSQASKASGIHVCLNLVDG